ncbi:MAG: DUF6364 family protein [Terriglobales bacterium]
MKMSQVAPGGGPCLVPLLEKREKWTTPVSHQRALFRLTLIMGFTYYGSVNITLSIDDDVVKEVRKIALDRDTTLTALVRTYLQELAAEHAKSGRKRRELEALEESFKTLQFNMGEKTWTREDLYKRGPHYRPPEPK